MPTLKTVKRVRPVVIEDEQITVRSAAVNIHNRINEMLVKILPLAVQVGADSISAFPSIRAILPHQPKKLKPKDFWVEITDDEIRQALKIIQEESPLGKKWQIAVEEASGDFKVTLAYK